MPQVHTAPEPPPVDWTPDPEYADWTDGQVTALLERVRREDERRRVMVSAAVAVERAALTYRAAAGISDGTAWQQPTGAHDAVPPDSTRVFPDGKLRRNVSGKYLSHGPVEYPAGWEVVAEDVEPVEPDPAEHRAWAPGMVLAVGDVVAYEGVVYEVVQAHTSAAHWLPSVLPALYRKVA